MNSNPEATHFKTECLLSLIGTITTRVQGKSLHLRECEVVAGDV